MTQNRVTLKFEDILMVMAYWISLIQPVLLLVITLPDFTYGFGGSFRWKGIDFGIVFQGVYGNEIS